MIINKSNIGAVVLGFITGVLFMTAVAMIVYSRCNPDTPELSPSEYSLTDWEILELAIIKTESDFNPLARGKANDLGIFQGTEIWVEDVNRIVGEPKYVHTDCLDIDKSIEMFDIIQNHYNPNHDPSLAINKHNPGGDAIGYSIRVRKNIEWVKKYEEIKAHLTNYNSNNTIE